MGWVFLKVGALLQQSIHDYVPHRNENGSIQSLWVELLIGLCDIFCSQNCAHLAVETEAKPLAPM